MKQQAPERVCRVHGTSFRSWKDDAPCRDCVREGLFTSRPPGDLFRGQDFERVLASLRLTYPLTAEELRRRQERRRVRCLSVGPENNSGPPSQPRGATGLAVS